MLSGEVIVQRLNWQNLWTQESPSDSAEVRGLDWRPDERILAIGYDTGLMLLIDVENQQEIHALELDSEVKCLGWTQNTKEYHDDSEDIQDNRMVRLTLSFLLTIDFILNIIFPVSISA